MFTKIKYCLAALLLVYFASVNSMKIEPRMMEGAVPTTNNFTTYIASIRVKSVEEQQGFGYGYICDGVIISQNLILTTTSCLMTGDKTNATLRAASDLIVVVGSTYRYTVNDQTLQYDVDDIYSYDNFNATSLENDIAVLYLNASIPTDWATAKPIQINTQAVPVDTQCTVTSWQTKLGMQLPSSQIVLEYVTIKNNSNCFEGGTAVSDLPAELSESMICAAAVDGVGMLNSCAGDSGAPLACNNTLAGIVSWGNGCNFTGPFPGVYTNVSAFYDWIVYVNTTASNGGGIDTTTEHHGDGAPSILNQSKYAVFITMVLAFILRH